MKEDNAIEIKGLGKKYYKNNASTKNRIHRIKNNSGEPFYALKNINLNIKQGEVIGIVGPNGAGKSTLLKILAEVTTPSEGSIRINGKVASILEVGIGFQPELSGYENIFLSGNLYGLSKKNIESKIDNIIEMFGFPDFINTKVKHYSSGMYMRLAFSIIINIDADIYLFDEVLSVGDIQFQKRAVEEIKKLNNKNATILIVTHNLKQIDSICTKLCLFNNGELIEAGDPYKTGLLYIGKTANPELRSGSFEKIIFPQKLPLGLKILSVKHIHEKNLLKIKLNLESDSNKTFSSFRFIINKRFENQTISVLSVVSSQHKINGKFTISLNIDNQNLLEGEYLVDFFATDSSNETASLINLFWFEIKDIPEESNKYWILENSSSGFEITVANNENP